MDDKERKKIWAKEHPEKVLEANRRWQEKEGNREKILAAKRRWAKKDNAAKKAAKEKAKIKTEIPMEIIPAEIVPAEIKPELQKKSEPQKITFREYYEQYYLRW